MADFPAPQSAPATATAPVSAGVLAYALFAIAAVLEIAKTGFLAPAPFMTIISESVPSLFSTCAIATTSAIGAITRIKSGTISPVMPTNTRMV